MTRQEIQDQIKRVQNRASVEEWLLEELGEESGAIVCGDLDSYDWSEV